MNITPQQILFAISIASTITTCLFWGAIYLGRLTARLERVEGRVTAHDAEIARLLRVDALKP